MKRRGVRFSITGYSSLVTCGFSNQGGVLCEALSRFKDPSSEARPKGGIEIWVSHHPYPQARSGIGMEEAKTLTKSQKG